MVKILKTYLNNYYGLIMYHRMAQEGKIVRVEVYGCQKRYDPEKYYVYILKVFRENQRDPSYLFRSYKELSEFQQKLLLLFPLAKFLR